MAHTLNLSDQELFDVLDAVTDASERLEQLVADGVADTEETAAEWIAEAERLDAIAAKIYALPSYQLAAHAPTD